MNDSGLPGTKSVLDYGLVDSDHVNTVNSFIIDEQARYSCGTDHALLECNVIFDYRPHINWAFHEVIQYNFVETSCFKGYQHSTDESGSQISLSKFSILPGTEMITHITESITSSAMKSFGLKTKNPRS